MTTPPGVDLQAFHVNAAAAIAGFMASSIDEVSAYKRYDVTLPARLVAFELSEVMPENPDDAGTEQFHASLRFAAVVSVSFTREDYKLEVRKLAVQLAAKIYGKRFGCPVGPAKIISVMPDDFTLAGKIGPDGEAEDYAVYKVEWSHEAFIGESVWDNEGVEPVSVTVSGLGETSELLEAPAES